MIFLRENLLLTQSRLDFKRHLYCHVADILGDDRIIAVQNGITSLLSPLFRYAVWVYFGYHLGQQRVNFLGFP